MLSKRHYNEDTQDYAGIVAHVIQGDKIAGYLKTGKKDEYYYNTDAFLAALRDEVDLTDISVFVPDGDEIIYIWDTSGAEGDCDLGDRTGAFIDYMYYFQDAAAKIQQGILPKKGLQYEAMKEFDLAASMMPAREVGGDFYDIFMADDRHLALVIADVSGKGVPASLFMVASKIVIKYGLKLGKSPAEVFSDANEKLIESNDMDLFGEDRLVCALNKNIDASPEELLKNVKDSIDSFVGDSPQFDDITMLAFRYNGKQ